MLFKTEFMLADSFEATGEWWLRENPEAKIHGTLRYSHTNIELELSGSLDNVTAEEFLVGGSKFKDHPCIQGRSNDGQKFTLLKAGTSSYGSTTKYSAFFIIAGKHTTDAETLKLTSVSFYCNHLDTFIARNLFSMEHEGEKEHLKSVTIKYVQPDTLSWRIDDIAATLDLQTGVTSKSGRMNHELHARSFVTITPHTPQELDLFIRQVWRFCYLLTLVTDEVVSPTGLMVDIEGEQYKGWLLYRSSKEPSDDADSVAPVFLFHLDHIISDFESILKKWFSVNETMLDAIHLTMDAHRNSDQSMHGRFLLLAHAVEVISRATTSSEYMSPADYERIISTLNAAIPSEVPSDHRMSLKSRIKYGNEFAFHKRIKVLLESLSVEAREIVCNNAAEFARGIADTRNYYTHFTDELRPKALTGAAEYWATEKLLLLVRILLFKYLDIDETVIVKRLSTHHRLLQRIFYSKKHPECMAE